MPTESQLLSKSIQTPRPQRLCSLAPFQIDRESGIFSFEKDSQGRRTHHKTAYSAVYDLLKCQNENHCYEVIVSDHPCHLYFDVEYLFADHPDFDGDVLVARLINHIAAKLAHVFGKNEYELIHLDATTPKKFSRHLIFRSDSFCFRNNHCIHDFVLNEILSVDDPFIGIVDKGVYSKNRNFRCVWSTKYANGTQFPLKPIDGSHATPRQSNIDFFKRTLITFVGDDPQVLQYTTETSPVPVRVEGHPIKASDVEYTGIEDFALAAFAPNASIRNQKYSPECNTLCLVVCGSRFCRNVGREHKSNGVYIVCRLTAGVVVQKCFDPDCRGFESEAVPIPPGMLSRLRGHFAAEVCYTSQKPKQIDLDCARRNGFLHSDSDPDDTEEFDCIRR
jgi:hypothetical protein